MLMPTVINAQTIAAKTEAIWLREVRVISNSFVIRRTIPAMPGLLHGACQFIKSIINQNLMQILSVQSTL